MSYTDLKNKLAEVLETAYQVPKDDIAALLPEKEEEFKADDFKSKFLDLDKDRIQAINQKGKDKFEQGYKKATGEILSNFEKEIKQEFNIDDDDLQGLDLVKKTVELSAKTQKADVSKLTEDELKVHPAVIKILNEKDKNFKEQEKKLKEDFDTKLDAFNKKERFNKVSKKALSILDGMNPILSTDPTRAANQKSILLKELEKYDYQEENDDFTPLVEGKRLENEHGHGINFEQMVKSEASKYFDFKKADDRDTPPPGGDGGSGGGSGGSLNPKTEAEYAKILSDRSISIEDRQKVKEAWQNKQAAS